MTMFAVMLFCLPETLYLRGSTPVVTDKPILRRMKLWGLRPKDKHLKVSDFFRQFIMFVSSFNNSVLRFMQRLAGSNIRLSC